MNKPEKIVSEDLYEPLTYPVQVFISREYAEAEPDLLWSMAGRVEELADVGITYKVCHDSIPQRLSAPRSTAGG